MASARSRSILTPARRRRLLEAAAKVRGNAHAPYSRFTVGSAVLDEDGRVFAGCNVENESSASTLCAEQSAVARAVSEGARVLVAVAVVAAGREILMPCGRCRQVLAEFGPAMTVLSARPGEEAEEVSLADLLPRPFRR